MKSLLQNFKKCVLAGLLTVGLTKETSAAAASLDPAVTQNLLASEGVVEMSQSEWESLVKSRFELDTRFRDVITTKPEFLPALLESFIRMVPREQFLGIGAAWEGQVLKMTYRATRKLQALAVLRGTLESELDRLDFPVLPFDGGDEDTWILSVLSPLTAFQKERLMSSMADSIAISNFLRDIGEQAPPDLLEEMLTKYTGLERSLIEDLRDYHGLLERALEVPTHEVEPSVLIEALASLDIPDTVPLPWPHPTAKLFDEYAIDLTLLRAIVFNPEQLGAIRESLRDMVRFEESIETLADHERIRRGYSKNYGHSIQFKFIFKLRDKLNRLCYTHTDAKDIKTVEEKIRILEETLSAEPEKAEALGAEIEAQRRVIGDLQEKMMSTLANPDYLTQVPWPLVEEKMLERLAFNEGYLQALRAHRVLLRDLTRA